MFNNTLFVPTFEIEKKDRIPGTGIVIGAKLSEPFKLQLASHILEHVHRMTSDDMIIRATAAGYVAATPLEILYEGEDWEHLVRALEVHLVASVGRGNLDAAKVAEFQAQFRDPKTKMAIDSSRDRAVVAEKFLRDQLLVHNPAE